MSQVSFGTINLEELLASTERIELTLIDSATKRPVSGTYSYSIVNNKIKIVPRENPGMSLILDKEIQLTPDVISFVGLYLGDGNKTGNIGFSQREINILKFAHDVEAKLFGNNFRNRWSILEDTRRFETPSMKKRLKQIEKEVVAINKHLRGDLLKLEAQREFLIREFISKAIHVGLKVSRDDINRPVVSPLKGARALGQSSLEYIHDLYGSRYFLPLWLKIVYDVVDSIIMKNEEKEWIRWDIPPRGSRYVLNVQKYVSNIYYRTTSSSSRYNVTKILGDPDFIEISKRRGFKAIISKQILLSPFLFLISGLYLAEGDTKKEHIFVFDRERVPLRVALTSSEERVVKAFIEFLETLGKRLVNRWKVKVGSKYFIETEEIAQKMGVITLRGGNIGQGYVRTQELHEAAKNWALKEFPILKKYQHIYSNLEVTGVGIPRVHVMAKSTIDAYFVSLIRDAVFSPSKLFKYATRVSV